MIKEKAFAGIVIFLLVLVCFGKASWAATLTVASGSGSAGAENILIPVNLNSGAGEDVTGLNLDINFTDTGLIFNEVLSGEVAQSADKTVNYSTPSPELVRIIVFGLNTNRIADGPICYLSFDIASSASAKVSTLSLRNTAASDPNAQAVNLATVNGSISITASDSDDETTEDDLDQEEEAKEEETTVQGEQEPEDEEEEEEEEEDEEDEEDKPSGSVYITPLYIDLGADEQAEGQSEEIAGTAEEEIDVAAITTGESRRRGRTRDREQVGSKELTPMSSAAYREDGDDTGRSRAGRREFAPTSSVSREPRGRATQLLGAQEVQVKPVKRFLFWRTYKLKLKTETPPIYWQLEKGSTLPFGLRLNKKKGTIYGFALGKKELEVTLNVITEARRRITADCILQID